MSKVTVAAVQMTYGLENAVQRVEEAAAQGAQVILLPELFENWYFCQEKSYENYHLATTLEENPAVNALRTVARDFRVVLPVSYYERVGNTTFNTVAVIDADGTVLGQYRKTHIPDDHFYQEKFYFTPGDTGFRVWDTAYAKIGVGICWDQWFPESARCMALMGAELLFYPTAIGSEPILECDSMPHWRRCMQGHAAANIMPLVAANRIGTETVTPSPDNQNQSSSLTFYGSSFIADETGALVEQADRKRLRPDAYVRSERDPRAAPELGDVPRPAAGDVRRAGALRITAKKDKAGPCPFSIARRCGRNITNRFNLFRGQSGLGVAAQRSVERAHLRKGVAAVTAGWAVRDQLQLVRGVVLVVLLYSGGRRCLQHGPRRCPEPLPSCIVEGKAAAGAEKNDTYLLFRLRQRFRASVRFGAADFPQKPLARIVKQQLLIVREVGLAAKILDKPGGKVIRGQLGGEQHKLLAVRDGRVEESKDVRQLPVRAVRRVRARLHILLEQRLEPLERLPLRHLFQRERLLESREPLGLARGGKQRVLVGRACVAAARERGLFSSSRVPSIFSPSRIWTRS